MSLAPPPPPSQPSPEFRPRKTKSPAGSGRALRILYYCSAGSVGLILIALVYRMTVLNDAREIFQWSPSLGERFDNADSFVTASGVLVFYVGLATFILEIIWSYRMSRDLRSVGRPPRMANGMAIGGFFIPLANFVIPYLFLLDFIHSLSFQRTSVHTPSTRTVAVGWWLKVAGILIIFMSGNTRDQVETINGLLSVDIFLALGSGAILAGCIVSAAFVKKFNSDIDDFLREVTSSDEFSSTRTQIS